jgi:hypothetical protein
MRAAFLAFSVLMLSGCVSATTHEMLSREVGRTIADATLVAGPPDSWADMPDGSRAFVWELPVLVPTSPERCLYTLYAVLEGRPESLAAWRVVAIDPPAPSCAPGPIVS